MPNFWIVSSHAFVLHKSAESAAKEAARLAGKLRKRFFVYRVKNKVTADGAPMPCGRIFDVPEESHAVTTVGAPDPLSEALSLLRTAPVLMLDGLETNPALMAANPELGDYFKMLVPWAHRARALLTEAEKWDGERHAKCEDPAAMGSLFWPGIIEIAQGEVVDHPVPLDVRLLAGPIDFPPELLARDHAVKDESGGLE